MSKNISKKKPDVSGINIKRTVICCLAAFAAAVLCDVISLAINKVYPFGDNSVLFSDMKLEYFPFLTELWDKFHTGGSLLYSWTTALGGAYWGSFMYYLSSPFNLLLMLLPRSGLLCGMISFIFLRQSLSAATMTFFLCSRKGGTAGWEAACCGILYAFCGWFADYYYNVIWLDVFLLLPLILLGIEKIIDKDKPWLYFAVFALMLYCNYYLTYLVCIFAVIYWLFYFFSNYSLPKKNEAFFASRFFRAGVTFAGMSVLAVVLLGIFLIPLALQMSKTAANELTVSSATYFKDLPRHICSLFSGSYTSRYNKTNYPAVFSGTLPLTAVPLFFFLPEKKRKSKIAAALILLFFVLSFNLPALDYIWHGFRYTTGFPFRESFMFSAFIILLTYEALLGRKELQGKAFGVSAGMLGVLIAGFAAEKIRNGKNQYTSGSALVITVFLFCVIFVLLIDGRRKSISRQKVTAVLISAICIFDCFFNLFNNINIDGKYSDFVSETKEIDSFSKDGADDVFRTVITRKHIENDGALHNFKSVGQSSSAISSGTALFLDRMGLDSNLSNFNSYLQQTPVFNSFFGIKNLLENRKLAEDAGVSLKDELQFGYLKTNSSDAYDLYVNDSALSFGFEADNSLAEWQITDDVLKNQNTVYSAASGIPGDSLIECSLCEVTPGDDGTAVAVADNNTVIFDATQSDPNSLCIPVYVSFETVCDGIVYLYSELDSEEQIEYAAGGYDSQGKRIYHSLAGPTCFTSMNTAAAGETVRFWFFVPGGTAGRLSVRCFQVDSEVFSKQRDSLKSKGQMTFSSFSDTKISGNIEVSGRNSVICLTIPYDEGWVLSLDGNILTENDIHKIGDCLYGIPAARGAHTLEMHFSLPGFGSGVACSVLGLLITVAAIVLRRKLFFGFS